MHHPTDRITHATAFVTPVVEHWLEREIAWWVHPMKDQSDDPSHHERTLYLWATSRSPFLTETSLVMNALGHRVSQQPVARQLMAQGIRAHRSHRWHLMTVQTHLRLRWVLTVRLAEGGLHWWKPVLFVHSYHWRGEQMAVLGSCHLLKLMSWHGEGSVSRKGQHASSLTQTWQHSITS